MDSCDDFAKGDAAGSMRLWVEENFGMPDILFSGLSEVSPREVVEIAVAQKHSAALVVNVEKRLEIGKFIRPTDLFRRPKGHIDVVPRGQFKHQLGFERPLDMQMQLGFGHAFDEALHRFQL